MSKALAFPRLAALLLAVCGLLVSCQQSGGIPEISDTHRLEASSEGFHDPRLADAPRPLENSVSQGENDVSTEASAYEPEAQNEQTQPISEPVSAPVQQHPLPAPESQAQEQYSTQREPVPSYGEEAYHSATESGGPDLIDPALFEQELLRLINEERERQGIEPLGLEENMRWAARIRAQEVLISLSHARPDATPYYTAYDEAGFSYAGKWHGENVSAMYFEGIFYDSKTAAALMFEELRSSTGHYSNMLSQNFSQVGIGVFVQYDDGIVRIGSAQLFASFQ